MHLTIALRKEVDSVEQGQQITDIVKTKLIDHPEVQITASVSEQIKPDGGGD